MASIIERDGRWRVQVRRKGLRPTCKTFDSKEMAELWGKQEEKRMQAIRSNVLRDPMERPAPYQVSGIYMLFRGVELQYIGRSVHIYRRLNDHNRVEMDWDCFRIIPCADSIAAAHLEQTLIERHKPPLNLQMAVKRKKRRITGKVVESELLAPV